MYLCLVPSVDVFASRGISLRLGVMSQNPPFGNPPAGSGAPSGVLVLQQVDKYAQAVTVGDASSAQRYYAPGAGSQSS